MGLALVLAALSAVLHAAWNLLGRRSAPSVAFFASAELCAGAALAPLLPWAVAALAPWPTWCWGLLAASCACQAASYAGIAAAYRHGDFSAAYPLVRALPVLALTLGGGLLGWRAAGPVAIAGAAVVAGGCLLVPLRAWGDWRLLGRGLADPALLWAAMCICGYSLTDAVLAREARAAAGHAAAPALAACMALGNGLLGWLLVAVVPAERRHAAGMRGRWRAAAATGAGIWLSYGAMLAALALASQPGPALAVRQLSIPLAALAAVLVLRERAGLPRWCGIALVAAGAMLAAAG